MAEGTPYVYLILGPPGAGRRDVVADLLEDGAPNETSVLVFSPEDEPTSPMDERIAAFPNVTVAPWRLRDGRLRHDSISAADHVFILAPGRANPADAAEAAKGWMDKNGCRLARILTVVDCGLLQDCPDALPWIDACVHFSDIVLLNRRERVSNRWVQDFRDRYERARYPCHFRFVKKGRTPNPLEILEPEARRISLYFDEYVPIEEDEIEEERPDDLREDPYIERLASGQRAKPVPEIGKILDRRKRERSGE